MRSRERPRHRLLIATAAALVIAIGALAAFALAGGFDKTTTESVTQPVVDQLAQLLQRVKDLPGRVPLRAAQRDTRGVPRSGGLGW